MVIEQLLYGHISTLEGSLANTGSDENASPEDDFCFGDSLRSHARCQCTS
jgi:hypothetical protein